jgi:hypothetical protein
VRHTAVVFVQLIIAVACFGQQQPILRFEDNPVWGIRYGNYQGPEPIYVGFLHSYSDTIWICNHRYDVVDMNEFGYQVTGYVRSLGQKTYLRVSADCADREYLLYDFSLNIGDSVFVGGENLFDGIEDSTLIVVTSVDTVVYSGVARKTIGLWGGYGQWIEGIGSNRHPFYPLGHLHGGSELDAEVLCLDSLGNNLLESGCDSTILYLDIKQETLPKLAVYPNPSRGSVQISFHDFFGGELTLLRVFSLLGDLVFEEKVRDGIEQLNLPVGIYLITVFTERDFTSKKVVILPPE